MSPSTTSEPKTIQWTQRSIGVAIALVVLLALMIWRSLPLPEAKAVCGNHIEHYQNAKAADNGPVESPTDCISPSSAEETAQANHEENPWPEIFIAWGTWALFFGTVFLGFWTYRLWAETRNALSQAKCDAKLSRKQTGDLFVQERRAWIRPELTPAGDFSFDRVSGRVSITFNTLFENHGDTPAFSVYVLPRVHVDNREWFALEELMRTAVNPPMGNVGDTVFPRHRFPSQPPIIHSDIFQIPQFPMFSLIGWVAYRIIGSDEIKRTPFNYRVVFLDNVPFDGGTFTVTRWRLLPADMKVAPT